MNDARSSSILPRMAAAVGRMARSEDGGAYTITYLMVIPCYLLTMYTIIETALVLNSKLGATYAAHAAARAALVRPGSVTDDAVRRAGVVAFVPFAHSVADASARGDAVEDRVVRLHEAAARDAGLEVTGVSRLRRQYRYANRALRVAAVTRRRGEPWEEDVEVTVTYEFPFSFPIVGRLIGAKGTGGRYVLEVVGNATLPMENPSNEKRSLGIRRP